MSAQASSAPANGLMKSEASYRSPPSTLSDASQQEVEDHRGRLRDRDRSFTAKAEEDSGGEKIDVEETVDGKPRKRKRSRKSLEKNFACPENGCGKSYSRAEHLYRHQLNHQPKKIYVCEHPGCERRFVRQDLCTRHQERHTNRGSHLQRKDNALHSTDPASMSRIAMGGQGEQKGHDSPHGSARSAINGGTLESYSQGLSGMRLSGNQQNHSPPASNISIPSEYGPSLSSLKRSHSDEQYYPNSSGAFESPGIARNASNPALDLSHKQSTSSPQNFARLQKSMSSNPYRSHSGMSMPNSSAQYRPSSASSYDSLGPSTMTPGPGQDGFGDDTYSAQQNYPPLMPLPPPTYASPQPGMSGSQITFTSHSNSMSTMDATGNYNNYSANGLPGLDTNMMDANANGYHVPYWDGDAYGSSPRNPTDDFVNMLFNEQTYPQNGSPGGPRHGSLSSFGATAFMEDFDSLSRSQYGLENEMLDGNGGPSIPQQHPMALKTILDPASLHAILSDEKRREILDLIKTRFTDYAPVSKQKDDLLHGNPDAEGHVLSLRQMQLYIRSYWYHFHPQMPILHKPTFSANNAQNLLLIAVVAIGASCLDKMHGSDMTEAGSDLSNFLAWHLRGEVFKHKDFSPPAQLWIFQTLLLLEVYEKMYSTRVLHERAHIHHGTTLTLMRRGSSLIGRSPLDSPPTETAGSETNNNAQIPASNTPEQWWNHWITNEATRRVAFAAYIIDSIHATMFGHQATMVAHEMKLALPCDESLWSATSSAEVAKREADFRAKGIKSMTFFDGLKSTLKGKPVQTNPFGRMAIMAGLLSVTWHMNQRDVQIHHLGALKALGGKDVWRGPLTKAFDSWKDDFDASMTKENISFTYSAAKFDEENIFESRTVLHHLSHMAMHVDVVSCQIFAGAGRLLGRTTLQTDYEIAQKRIRQNWAPRASARHATFYALKFLAQVLLPDSCGPYASPKVASTYSARDDYLLNRPWVLYYAILVVWSYGYALDGPIKDPPALGTTEEQYNDMRQYLAKFGSIQAPLDLGTMRDRNACLGLLYVLREKFDKCRWQLLREAAKLLDNCVDKLRGEA